ncbi:MAG: hypothetical protein IT168_18995 [Bryobacterales bacterium]|nr:hypothetical protein [Bryobacterales bacterium]
MAPTPKRSPNLYELTGTRLKVTYSSSSISGKPLLTIRQGRKDQQFTGNEIKTDKTQIGQLITVTLEAQPDRKTVLFSVLLPDVNLPDSLKSTIKTEAVVTTIKTTIAGPPKGQVQTYKTVLLSGMARSVDF